MIHKTRFQLIPFTLYISDPFHLWARWQDCCPFHKLSPIFGVQLQSNFCNIKGFEIISKIWLKIELPITKTCTCWNESMNFAFRYMLKCFYWVCLFRSQKSIYSREKFGAKSLLTCHIQKIGCFHWIGWGRGANLGLGIKWTINSDGNVSKS